MLDALVLCNDKRSSRTNTAAHPPTDPLMFGEQPGNLCQLEPNTSNKIAGIPSILGGVILSIIRYQVQFFSPPTKSHVPPSRRRHTINPRAHTIVFPNTKLAFGESVRRKASTKGPGRSTSSNLRRACRLFLRPSAARARPLSCLLPVEKNPCSRTNCV